MPFCSAFVIGHSVGYQSEGKRSTPYRGSLRGILTENARMPRMEGQELHQRSNKISPLCSSLFSMTTRQMGADDLPLT